MLLSQSTFHLLIKRYHTTQEAYTDASSSLSHNTLYESQILRHPCRSYFGGVCGSDAVSFCRLELSQSRQVQHQTNFKKWKDAEPCVEAGTIRVAVYDR